MKNSLTLFALLLCALTAAAQDTLLHKKLNIPYSTASLARAGCSGEIPMVVLTPSATKMDSAFTYENCIDLRKNKSDSPDPKTAHHLSGTITIRLHDLYLMINGVIFITWKGNVKLLPVKDFVYDTKLSASYDFVAVAGIDPNNNVFSAHCERYTSVPYYRGR